ncbi:bifunctional 2-C-methyl-D-erythritol 4-phosphate cytidylyltransferase/2-C-methyl-D-erythritol 2,4-cyclodiphosphate synthase [Gymnodinialimonas ceratoperidinii]|uniref:Bifunctional enzyme IspD/IspF n=1 Tax=Gymnodinialimonas ceratoperidinii TaxID=2856823 RepID=A0A8F6TV63_9RHOB|nr:bifunctional 2-C-methyl-D-erythritol 4-phosphate cytidylyltransferase/2-C-methyl-D-erythritol 2,4-cyclodiphosphate synthase [Gymnodinialimonas ceratoperidinii]QXT38327.1 bifunctional 2-C-methyl-D-erythritol 4-phosphate cytidylyltransferase/2-C-methyl-D-erythritol 2,4-cyclodiphosphate synthase [Gymnodinialimonas ceratoperidinii]
MTDLPPSDGSPKACALIVAAGRGTRLGGGIPKQYRDLCGEPVISRTIRAFDTHPAVTEIVVVTHADDRDIFDTCCPSTQTPLRLALGGATRDDSVRAGLAMIEDCDRVLIHDAARPLISRAVIDGVLNALDTHEGAAPALPVTDALWRGEETVEGVADRTNLWRAQTPQGFHLDAIRAAHAAHDGPAADDVAVARALGMKVAITPGSEDNLKLTAPGDFERATAILERVMDIRVGNGFDVHRFGPGNQVWLCGVSVPHDRGLQGHSDADVGLHTVTDAIYGALAEGDIGTHFPPSDPQWKGAESHIFLTHAVDLAASHGFTISNVDLTLMCERPKIGPVAAEMRARLAELLRIETARVSVKATTTERLGFTGREEGIAAMATATLVRK